MYTTVTKKNFKNLKTSRPYLRMSYFCQHQIKMHKPHHEKSKQFTEKVDANDIYTCTCIYLYRSEGTELFILFCLKRKTLWIENEHFFLT